MTPITMIRSRTVVLPQSDIDTDQIIPARFLTTTSRDGLGQRLFYDWRYDQAGNLVEDFPLNQTAAQGCEILVAGNNFGCGSSREHAPWALLDYGFRAVISSQVADIFRNNSIKNGLIPVEVEPTMHERLLANPGCEVAIDIATTTLSSAGQSCQFPLDGFAQHCLLNGIDELGFLLSQRAAIDEFEQVLR